MADEKTVNQARELASEELGHVAGGGKMVYGTTYAVGDIVKLECHSCGGEHDFVCTSRRALNKEQTLTFFQCQACHNGTWVHEEILDLWGWKE
jgi:DNA-directed RNA polymerase subunit M/transcription elongation factor TFIIS